MTNISVDYTITFFYLVKKKAFLYIHILYLFVNEVGTIVTGEGAKPLFEREELSKAAASISEVEERRISDSVNGGSSGKFKYLSFHTCNVKRYTICIFKIQIN